MWEAASRTSFRTDMQGTSRYGQVLRFKAVQTTTGEAVHGEDFFGPGASHSSRSKPVPLKWQYQHLARQIDA